jgi:type II secretory pathway pseudopilin PulG
MVELMVVVAIIGVLASAAAISMSPDPDVEDEAYKIAALVNEASRLAISGGPVDPSMSQTGNAARGRVRVRDDGQGQYLLIERLDDQAGFNEIERKRVILSRRVRVAGVRFTAGLTPGEGPQIPFMGEFVIYCRPDGTCTSGADFGPPNGGTLYLQDVQRPNRRARVVVLPLNGMMTQVFSGW